VIDLMLVLPSFFLIAIMTTGGEGPSAWMLLVCCWRRSAGSCRRVVRNLSLSVKEREYVRARFMGCRRRGCCCHIVPNIASMLIVDVCLGWATPPRRGRAVYFGFGVQARTRRSAP
jgi:peptide/nickel transport system permease protein